MPKLKPKAKPPQKFPFVFGSASGQSSTDFFVLAYCPDLDEAEKKMNPLHQEFTYIVHFHGQQRDVIGRHNERLETIWQSPSGQVYAVGAPQGYFEISPNSCQEVGVGDIPGTSEAIWGLSDNNIFLGGTYEGFILHRRMGTWQNLPLPKGTIGIRDIYGTSANDVYFVGDRGVILHFDGTVLRRLPCPTTRHLNSIQPIGKTHMCIGGYQGTLLFGNRAGWRLIDTDTEEPLLNLAHYNGTVCYCNSDGTFSFDGRSKPQLLTTQKGRWINGLVDDIMLVDGDNSFLYANGALTQLDSIF